MGELNLKNMLNRCFYSALLEPLIEAFASVVPYAMEPRAVCMLGFRIDNVGVKSPPCS